MCADNKLQQKTQINLQNKKKKGRHKKITGFQVNICWSHTYTQKHTHRFYGYETFEI